MNGDSEQKNKNIDARIVKRYVLKGTVKLESPLLIGGGEGNAFIDINILKDSNGNPIIPGTSLAGVLLSMSDKKYKIFFGKMKKKKSDDMSQAENRNQERLPETQSMLSIDDITLEKCDITLRDGVKINHETGVAEDKYKFDYEAVERGAEGRFNIVLTIRKKHFEDYAEDADTFMKDLAVTLENGIFVGAHTTKGFGKIKAEEICLNVYDYSKIADIKAWLLDKDCGTITEFDRNVKNNEEDSFSVEAEFLLNNSLIVRTSNFDEKDYGDVFTEKDNITAAQLLSNGDYAIPGASVRGVICQRAKEIMKMSGKSGYEEALKSLFGFASENKKEKGYSGKKSRLVVEECYISRSNGSVRHFKQTRNRIDRFTGGTINSALMQNIPVWKKSANADKPLKLSFHINNCRPWEAGLMLFVLKDLWTGMVAFGGEKSIGRGTLKGIKATINLGQKKIVMTEENGKINVSDNSMPELENLAKAFADETTFVVAEEQGKVAK